MAKPDYVALTFPSPPPGRPYVVVNMVMSADGKVVLGENGAAALAAAHKARWAVKKKKR